METHHVILFFYSSYLSDLASQTLKKKFVLDSIGDMRLDTEPIGREHVQSLGIYRGA